MAYFLKVLTETLLKIPFSVIGRSFLVTTSHWLQEKYARINLSQAASSMILQSHRRLSKLLLLGR
jgi:hypothetical protein